MIYASKNNDVGSKQLLILIGSDMLLIHFSSMFQFYTSWKSQKIPDGKEENDWNLNIPQSLYFFFSFKHKLSIRSSSVQRDISIAPRNEMNSDIKQEKERVNQYVRNEKVIDCSAGIDCAFLLSAEMKQALSSFSETAKN